MNLFRLHPLPLALALALAVAGPALQAQSATAPVVAGQPVRIQIPAQPLAQALNEWARQTRMQLVVQQSAVAGKTAPAVSGVMTPQLALDRLLAGSGLWARIEGNLVTVETRPPSAREDEVLPLVSVAATDGGTGDGPVGGYVARRSVAATKTDTAVLEAPMTINVVPREQIENLGARRLTQALRYTPGLSADIRGDTSRFDMLAVRGIGAVQDSFQFLDGLRLPRGVSYLVPQIDANSLERVDVLKGPASVMYGQAPLGGIVNMTSKRPSAETFRELSVAVGSNNQRQLTWDSTGALAADGTLAYRLTALARKSDTSVKLTHEERVYVAPSLSWNPSERTSLTVMALYQHDPKGGYYGVLPSSGSILTNPNGQLPRDFFDGSPNFHQFDRKQGTLGYALSHKLDETWTLKQNLRWLRMTLTLDEVGSSGLRPDNRTLNRYTLWSTERLNAVNVDTQLQGRVQTGALEHQLLVGLDLQRDRWQQTQGFGPAPALDILTPDYSLVITRPNATARPDRTQRLAGFYVQDQIRHGRTLLTLGGRYDHAHIRLDNQIANTLAEQSPKKFNWRAGLSQQLDGGIAPYASIATSFDPSVIANPYGTPFKPTTGKQVEIGVKVQPPGTDALFTVSAFDLTQQNVLTPDTSSPLPNARIQTGEVNSRGVELEARFSPAKGFNVIAGLSAIDPQVTRSNGADLNKRPVSVAKTTATAWGDYRFGPGALAGLSVGAGVRHVGGAFADPANAQPVPAYSVMDAMLRYELRQLTPSLSGMSFALNVANLADKTYFTCNAVNFCNYGQGRTVVATLRHGW